MANKIAQLVQRRRMLVLAVSIVAAVIGARFGHPGGHAPGLGFWDGPL